MNIKLKDMGAVKFNGIDIGAVKFNGEYVWRKGSVIVLNHSAGTFKASAEGTGIKWKYKDQEVMSGSCNFTIDESDNNVYLLFNKELSKFTCNNDDKLLLDLADLSGKITNTLNLYGCKNITGDLSDLNGKITNTLGLSNCSNITGIYSGQSYPKAVYLSNTGLSASDMDSTLINFANSSVTNGTFTANSMTRTSASDDAVVTLTERGWEITGLTKVEA